MKRKTIYYALKILRVLLIIGSKYPISSAHPNQRSACDQDYTCINSYTLEFTLRMFVIGLEEVRKKDVTPGVGLRLTFVKRMTLFLDVGKSS